MLTHLIIPICWFIFLAYWLFNWRHVKPTLYTKNSFKKQSVALVLFILTLLSLKLLASNHFFAPLCSLTPQICNPEKLTSFTSLPLFLQITSSILTISGLIVAIISRHTLGENWSGKIDIKKNHKLITTGIYKHIRHPIYTGVILMAAGTFLNFNLPSAAIIFLFIFTLLIYKLKKEEDLLTKYFPKEYPEYKRHTKSLIPFLF